MPGTTVSDRGQAWKGLIITISYADQQILHVILFYWTSTWIFLLPEIFKNYFFIHLFI